MNLSPVFPPSFSLQEEKRKKFLSMGRPFPTLFAAFSDPTSSPTASHTQYLHAGLLAHTHAAEGSSLERLCAKKMKWPRDE